jgi:hypothetical protein
MNSDPLLKEHPKTREIQRVLAVQNDQNSIQIDQFA